MRYILFSKLGSSRFTSEWVCPADDKFTIRGLVPARIAGIRRFVKEMAYMVCSKLHFNTVNGLAIWAYHDSCIVNEHVNSYSVAKILSVTPD